MAVRFGADLSREGDEVARAEHAHVGYTLGEVERVPVVQNPETEVRLRAGLPEDHGHVRLGER